MKKSRNDEKFHERLQLAMKNAGISQADLARKLGTAWSTVARWQSGSMPRSKTLLEIAAVLGVASRWLECGEGEMNLPASFFDPEAALQRFPKPVRPIVAGAVLAQMVSLLKPDGRGRFLDFTVEDLESLAYQYSVAVSCLLLTVEDCQGKDAEIERQRKHFFATVRDLKPRFDAWSSALIDQAKAALPADKKPLSGET